MRENTIWYACLGKPIVLTASYTECSSKIFIVKSELVNTMKNNYLYSILIIFLITISSCSYQVEALLGNESLAQIHDGYSINYINKLLDGGIRFGGANNNIVNSYINIINCSIMGEVDFRGITFENPVFFLNNEFRGRILTDKDTHFKKSVSFASSKFTNETVFNEANFWDAAIFKNCMFYNSSSFTQSNFTQDASFLDAEFSRAANFNRAIFGGIACFRNSKFNNSIDFLRSSFMKDAQFNNIISNNSINFQYVKFNELADFQSAEISKGRWTKCYFNGEANFDGTTFKNIVYFKENYFNGPLKSGKYYGDDVTFSSSKFNDTPSFALAEFKGYADFSSAQFKKNADFRRANFAGEGVDFKESKVDGDIDLSNVKIKGNLSLERAKYNKLYVRWENLAGKLIYDDAAYMMLIKNFRDLGMLDDADACYYEYRNHRRILTNLTTINQKGMLKTLDIGFRKFVELFLDFLYRYGVDPLRPFILSLMTIIIFAVIWRIIGVGKQLNGDRIRIHKDGELSVKMKLFFEDIISLKEALIFSFLVFISAAKFIVETTVPKIPVAIEEESQWSKYILSSERVIAGLLIALFFLAVSRTIVRNT